MALKYKQLGLNFGVVTFTVLELYPFTAITDLPQNTQVTIYIHHTCNKTVELMFSVCKYFSTVYK